MSDSIVTPWAVHRISQARILEWISYFLLQGIIPTQGWKLDLLYYGQILVKGLPDLCDIFGSLHPSKSNYKIKSFKNMHSVVLFFS